MKTQIKYFILSLFAISVGYCQNDFTELSESQYNTIKFHDVLFTDIKATNGDTSQMANLFPVDDDNQGPQQIGANASDPNAVTIDEFGHEIGEDQKYFKYNSGLEVYFAKKHNNSGLELVGIKAKKITIDGISLEIGDSISDLTSINYNLRNVPNGNKLVLVVQDGLYAYSLSLRLDSNNNLSEIHYYENP
jgi:hypothetical protein